jgi:signal transduction histidine kinase
VRGVITTQSFEQNAYTDYHVNILRNLAAYAAVAIDNAEAYRRLNVTLEHLKTTQEQLVTQEKLASLGALTAGIAHEIKNPLNFVNNFAELSVELADELSSELEERKDARVGEVLAELDEILTSLRINAQKINENGKRADGIVRSMMQHARGGEGQMQRTEVSSFVDEYVNLAYHGMRAQHADFSVNIVRDYASEPLEVDLMPQEIGRVLINLLSNAFQAVHELDPPDQAYQPQVRISTEKVGQRVAISVSDNGLGVPEHIQERIFEPFFTTKPTGSGTGLGLSMSYDIVTKTHGGSLTLDSKPGAGATFSIVLPM